MKKWILKVVFLLVILTNAKGQNTQVVDNQKYIEVAGEGEIAFVPDQITYSITINDDAYTDVDEHLMGNQKALQALIKSRNEARSAQIWDILKSEGINENQVVKSLNFNFSNQVYAEYEAKSFVIKINSFSKFQKIVDKLKETNICSGRIVDVQSNKIPELEDKVKILSLENATKKAEKWTLAANSKVGKVLQIKEIRLAFDNVVANSEKEEAATYPPYGQETFFVKGNLQTTKNGEFVVKQSIIVRFSIEN